MRECEYESMWEYESMEIWIYDIYIYLQVKGDNIKYDILIAV